MVFSTTSSTSLKLFNSSPDKSGVFLNNYKNGRKIKSQKYGNVLKIDQRPVSINNRIVAGHWETDNMEGKKSDSICVSTTIERKSRYTILSKLNGHGSVPKTQAVINRLKPLPEKLVKSITTDRGPENHGYQEIMDALGTKVYFCNPYHSWEKGSVEQINGLLRRYLPRKTNLKNITQQDLDDIVYELNTRPRKCLGYKTP